MTAEQKRLEEARNKKAPWKKWALSLGAAMGNRA